ncbi:MAG: hypothetical protein K9N51_10675 [Candidatus Pacebacteria bacterium]|nr:hypothetical protein [Candidatus Paceibacterota bacterium]
MKAIMAFIGVSALTAVFSLVVAGCGGSGDTPAGTESATPADGTETRSELLEKYRQEAEQEITAENAEEQLDQLVKEIESGNTNP